MLKHQSNKRKADQQKPDKALCGRGETAPPITPVRKWLFRGGAVIAVLVSILVALALFEGVLRLAGYGYPTGFFKQMRIGDRDFLVENDCFGFRFFPQDIARMPAAFRMPVEKPPGTYRIFILGESAAMGDPEPAFGAGRYLEMLLRERFPKAQFEVINVAMTAINSHAILPIARDCARHDGDLWILYMGNNEMLGPFGVATASGTQQPPPLAFVRLRLAIQSTRLGQLLVSAGQKLRGEELRPAPWKGMQMFTASLVDPDDPRRGAVYRNFEGNLRDIVRAGLDSGARILMSTVAVNLKDCPPFGSVFSGGLSVADRARVEQLLAEGIALTRQTNYGEALKRYEQAARDNPRSAELEYRWSECLRQLGNRTEARAHFQQACDLDALTFRANTHINDVIRAVARRYASPRLALFDAVNALEMAKDGDAMGREFFHEHVHFNFLGNYHLARGWAEQVARLLPEDISCGGEPAWASQDICERRLGLTDWDRGNVLKEVYGRLQQPPLSSQFNNPQRLQVVTELQAELGRRRVAADAARRAEDTYVEALKLSPDDYYLRQNYGNFLWDSARIPEAVVQWQKVRELIPQDHAAYFELGRLVSAQGKYAEAKPLVERTLAMRPSFAPGWFELGKIYVAEGEFGRAVEAYDRALVFQPHDAECLFHSGVALAALGRRSEAIARYRKAAELEPGNWRARFELGSLLGQEGRMAEARTETAEAVRLNPNFAAARLNLGLTMVQLGQLDEAEQQFLEAQQLSPTNSKAADYLDQIRALKRRQK